MSGKRPAEKRLIAQARDLLAGHRSASQHGRGPALVLVLMVMAVAAVATLVLPTLPVFAPASSHPFTSRHGLQSLPLASAALLDVGADRSSGARDARSRAVSRGRGSATLASPRDTALSRLQRQVKAQSARRQRWLDSRAARAQRNSSRMAFHGQGPAASERLLRRGFGSELSGVSANPAASLARSGEVVRYLSDYRALVRKPEGRLEIETSTVPLRVAHGSAPKRPVSLRLRQAGEVFAAVNPLESVSIAHDLRRGVVVGPEGLRITMQGADVAGTPLGDESVFFANVGTDEDATEAPTIAGAELSAVLRSRLAPEQIAYRVSLPPGATLHAHEGGAVISRNGKILARVPAPSARDAQDTYVPARLRVIGRELLLSVDHRDRDLAYPVLVDPEVITITEGSEDWHLSYHLEGEQEHGGCEVASMSGAAGSITQPATTFPGPCEGRGINQGGEVEPLGENKCLRYHHCVRCYYQRSCVFSSEGSEIWESTPLRPTTGRAKFAVEYDNVSFSESGTAPPIGVTWCIGGGCGSGSQSPPATSVISSEALGQKRSVSLFLRARDEGPEYEYGYPEWPEVTIGASLSAGAILVSESFIEEPGSETYGPANEGEPSRSDCLRGESVNCATGNQVVTQSDLEIGGRGPGLDLTRTYNSQLAAAGESGPFGYGWRGPYSARLAVAAGMAVVHQDNGSTVSFLEEQGGKYVPTSPLVQAKLVREGSRWIYTLPDQEKLDFDSEGRLVSQTDRNGNAITLSYEEVKCREEEGHAGVVPGLPDIGGLVSPGAGPAECPSPAQQRLATITDPAGRKITYSYNPEGLVQSATGPMGHTVKYGYENADLTSVTEPGESSPSWKFKYDSLHEPHLREGCARPYRHERI